MKALINFFIAIDKVFAWIVENLLIIILIGMTLLVATQVVLRNFFGSGITWADVTAKHCVLWVAFLGAMLATRSRQHIAIDVLTRFIPRKPRNVVRIGLDLLACIISFVLAKASLAFMFTERAMETELFIGMPTWIAQAVIPFGFAMISLEYAIGVGLDIYRIAKGSGYEAGKGRA